MRVTATAGDDATLSADGARAAAGLPALSHLHKVPIDFRSGGVTGMLYGLEPWRRPDHTPLPRIVPFPLVERVESRVRKVAREAGWRCRNAWRALRGDEWPDW